jgi:formylglycine-generating enzyme required for sulfatase activity
MKTFLIFSVITLAAISAVAQNHTADDFILIKGGTFTMGSPVSEPERGTDETQHRVTVDDYYIAKSSVAQREYDQLMSGNTSEFSGGNLPVENVTWFDAIRYCNARSTLEELTPAYTISGSGNEVSSVIWNREANGYRLPTEAEWEYACRAGTTSPFNTGRTINDEQANFYNHYGYNNDSSGRRVGGYRGRTTPINNYRANSWGLFDMHGNVADWCWDWYGAYNTAAQTNPTGPAIGTLRVNRGGGWNDFPKHIRSAYRAATPPVNSSFNLGFRLARNAR